VIALLSNSNNEQLDLVPPVPNYMFYGDYWCYMGRTTIEVNEAVRDELRRYKAQDGQTYDEAIAELLENSGWEPAEDIQKRSD